MLQGPGNNGGPVLNAAKRIDYIDQFRKGKTDADFIADEHRVIDNALSRGSKVYLVLTPMQTTYFRQRFISSQYEMKKLDHWIEPCRTDLPSSGGKRNDLVAPDVFGRAAHSMDPGEFDDVSGYAIADDSAGGA